MAINAQEEALVVEVDISAIYGKFSQPLRQMHKVAPQLRRLAQQSYPSVYDPMMVSLGPYHHGKPELRQAEEFKYLCLDWCSGGSETAKTSMYEEIFGLIDDIRSCYAEVAVVNQYDDKALALMMLLDACFIMNFMEFCACSRDRRSVYMDRFRCIGMNPCLTLTARDIYVLENQIPFFVLDLLIIKLHGEDNGREFLQRFFNFSIPEDLEQVVIPREYEDEPIHLLDAYRRVAIGNLNPGPNVHQQPSDSSHSLLSCCPFVWPKSSKKKHESSFRSVMELKAMGIKFHPGSSQSFQDVKFKSHALYGELHLPVRKVSSKSLVNLSNMIAFEMSLDGADPVVLSYVVLMKSLIQTPEDVKELQEQGIFLANRFVHPDEVVHLFKNINTLGLDSQVEVHRDVMQRVGEHCNNNANTWMAELIQGKLSNPWTITALLAAILVVILTILQTCYAIHPKK